MSTELSQWKKENTSISQYLYKIGFLFLRYSCHPRLGGCTRRGHDDADCSPTQVGCYSTHGGRGGGIDRYSCDPRLGVCTRRGHGDTYCGPTLVGCCFTHGGGGGGGFAGISKEWPYTSILCFDQGAYHDFLSFFFGGGEGWGPTAPWNLWSEFCARETGVVSKETLWNKNNLSCVIGKSLFHKMSCFENLISSIFLYSVQVNRVATYKELDSYFQKQSALFNVNLLVSVFKSGKLEKSWLFEGRKVEENLKTCSI